MKNKKFESVFYIDKLDRLNKAFALALFAHAGQKDKLGKPYILHPMAVASMGTTEEEMIVGALHDLLEDCDKFFIDQLEYICTSRELHALELLSRTNRDGTKKDTEAYYAAIKNDPEDLALKVKTNDILHNTSKERMNHLSEEDRERLEIKYLKAKEALGIPNEIDEIENLKTQNEDLKNRIEELEPKIINEEDGEILIKLAKGFMKNLVLAFSALNGNANYSSTKVKTVDDDREFEVIVQSAGKPTPHDLRKKAEEENIVLKERLNQAELKILELKSRTS